MAKKLSFNCYIKDVEQVNPLFSKCKIYIMYTNENRNNSFIEKNVVEENLYSLYNIPIVGEYNEKMEDFRDHGGKIEVIDKNGVTEVKYVHTTVPYGLVPESSEVNWEYVTEKDGMVNEYLTCTGYLWSGRYPEVFKVIDEGRPQSMEIDQVKGEFREDKKFHITSFVFSALTILGNDVEPCFESASIVAYQLDKEKFKQEFNLMIRELKSSLSGGEEPTMLKFLSKDKWGTGEKITISNSKEDANLTGAWSDVDKTSLRNKILEASNYKSLVKETYLIVGEEWESSPSNELKYPHHEIRDGKLIVHKGGCEAALSFLNKIDPNNTKAKTHLKKHYRELGLSTENFQEGGGEVKIYEKYGLTANDMWELMSNACNKEKYQDGDREYVKYWLRDYDESYVYCYDCENSRMCRIPYTIENNEPVIDFSRAEEVREVTTYVPVEDKDDEDDNMKKMMDAMMKIMKDMMGKVSMNEQYVKQINELTKQKEEFSKQITELTKEKEQFTKEKEEFNKQIVEKDNQYKDLNEKYTRLEQENTELKTFKAEKLEEERQSAINAVLGEFAKKLSLEEINQFREKAKNLKVEELDGFIKEVKLYVFDKENEGKFNFNYKPRFISMDTDVKSTNGTPQTVWDKYSDKK